MSEQDRSSFDRLNPMERRAFLRGLVASAVAAGAGLPIGLAALEEPPVRVLHEARTMEWILRLEMRAANDGTDDWRAVWIDRETGKPTGSATRWRPSYGIASDAVKAL